MSDAHITRLEIRNLLDGNAPNPAVVAQCNGWGPVVTALHEAHTQGGTVAVIRLFNGLVKADRNLATLMAQQPSTAPSLIETAPALPVEARAIYEHREAVGAWLDNYVSFASQAAPMTPMNFHEAAGLFAVSTVVARRLVLPLTARSLYPNLYLLYLAPSTVHHKSTGFGLVEQLMQEAGISHLLMPQKAPPEAFVNDLDHYKMPGKKIADLDFYLARRAFAPQRGYLRDEVSALFAGLRREFNAGLLELILNLYECPGRYEETTISRGDAMISNAYLSFFGASTPIEMAPYLAATGFWSNGLWARFALLIPDKMPEFVFFPPGISGMGALAEHLRRLYRLFPCPHAEITQDEDEQGHEEKRIIVHNQQPASGVLLAPGVWNAWETYNRALHTMLTRGGVEPELNANYGRFGAMAMKVAMLLATMDTEHLPVNVSLAHFARAQEMVETWRSTLHRVWSEQAETDQSRLVSRIVQRLATAPLTLRDLCQSLRCTKREIDDALALLTSAGRVSCLHERAANGRDVEIWSLTK